MNQLSKVLSRLPDFALPFVTRAMRGGRAKRYLALSALLALMTVVMGTWMALGEGPLERDLRVSLDFERSNWQREQNEYLVIAEADWEFTEVQAEIASLKAWRDSDPQGFLAAAADPEYYAGGGGPLQHYSRVSHLVRSAYEDLNHAALSVPPNLKTRVLRDRAAKYLNIDPPTNNTWDEDNGSQYGSEYAWYSEDAVDRIEAILDQDMVPSVERYRSPLSGLGAVKFIGALAAWLLAALAFAVAPIATAIQHAREVHHNTLQPLTGTAFSAKSLTRGLRSGYLAPLVIFALPLAAIVLGAAVIAGKLVGLALMSFIIAAGGYALVSLAQLFAHVAGQRRTPGMVGVAVMSLVGMSGFIGMIMGFEANNELYGAMGAVPQAGFTFMERWTFGNEVHFEAFAVLAMCVGTVCWGIAGGLVTHVLSRRIGGVEGPALSRGSALLGSTVSALLVAIAYAPIVNLGHVNREEPTLFFFLGLMSLAIPYAAILMARVPMSEAPATIRNLPLRSLILELFAMVGVYALITVPFIGTHAFNVLTSPIGMFYMAWGITVVGLVAVRSAACTQQGILSHLGIAYCMLCVFVAGIHAVIWTIPGHRADGDELVALWQLSPILGTLQLVSIVVVPLLLVRGLKQRFASLG